MRHMNFIVDGVFYFDQKTGLNGAKFCRKSSVLQRSNRQKASSHLVRLSSTKLREQKGIVQS